MGRLFLSQCFKQMPGGTSASNNHESLREFFMPEALPSTFAPRHSTHECPGHRLLLAGDSSDLDLALQENMQAKSRTIKLSFTLSKVSSVNCVHKH
jgi:hypothetical protein